MNTATHPGVAAAAARQPSPPPGSDYDPRRLQVHRPVPQRDVPYVPTDEAVVAAMLRFANVGPDDVVYDLGCGDGRIVIAAAKQRGARGVGVDIDPLRVRESRENAKRARVTGRVQFLCQSFFDTDLRAATVVMLGSR
jgi:predicted RNA methylase